MSAQRADVSRDRGATVFVVTEGLDEILHGADGIVVLSQGRITHTGAAHGADRHHTGASMGGHGHPSGDAA